MLRSKKKKKNKQTYLLSFHSQPGNKKLPCSTHTNATRQLKNIYKKIKGWKGRNIDTCKKQ